MKYSCRAVYSSVAVVCLSLGPVPSRAEDSADATGDRDLRPARVTKVAAADELVRPDYVTAAQGTWLAEISYSGAHKGPSEYQAFETYDGLSTPRGMLVGADPDAELELVFALPAVTSFDRFAVPEVSEVPGPSVTFFREIEVWGRESPSGDWQLLASALLDTHARRGELSELNHSAEVSVRFLKVVLRGGIENLQEKMGYQFSELIGNGKQEGVPLEDGFTGIWDTRLRDTDRSAGMIELQQDGVAVNGCFRGSSLTGVVSGNILRAQGISRDGRIPSSFVLLLDADGSIRGSANSNNGPFNSFGGPPAPEGSVTECSVIPVPEIGCGSTVYVQFEFDSAQLRSESEPVLADLYDGLSEKTDSNIVIAGHTSSEGSDTYNQGLSERRARAVVDDLVRRGLDSARIRATGRGEKEPIASNKDEAGRSLNRRVEVVCD